MYTFGSNKSFGQLLNISPKYFVFLKGFDSEFSHIDVWFIDENSGDRRQNKYQFIYKLKYKNDAIFSSAKREYL